MNFKFNGRVSDEFNIILCRIDEATSGMSREIIKGEKTKYRAKSNHFGTKYSDDLAFNMTIMKNPCETKQTDMRFTSSEIRAINAWLTSPQCPQSLKIFSDYYQEDIEYFAIINDITTESEGYAYELTFSVTCNAPFGWSKEYVRNLASTSSETSIIKIYNTSDEQERYVYPVIEVNPIEHGSIIIESVTDNRTLSFSGLKNNKIIIDSEKRKFHDSTGTLLTFEDIGIKDVDQIYLPKLLYGENIWKITGNADITITYREPRKVGVFN